jgi:hypothetical protein
MGRRPGSDQGHRGGAIGGGSEWGRGVPCLPAGSPDLAGGLVGGVVRVGVRGHERRAIRSSLRAGRIFCARLRAARQVGCCSIPGRGRTARKQSRTGEAKQHGGRERLAAPNNYGTRAVLLCFRWCAFLGLLPGVSLVFRFEPLYNGFIHTCIT